MNDIPLSILFLSLFILIAISGFFSISETSLVSINRYRLKHLVNEKNKGALRVQKLLDRVDRLLSLILIGNNFANSAASAIATIIGMRLYGDIGIAIATGLLTLALLVFAEVTPKTVAARSPDRFAYPASIVLRPLLIIFYPLVWIVNSMCAFAIRLLGFKTGHNNEALSPDELRSVVNEAGGLIPKRHQNMLLNILDLEQITVNDIMVPRNEISGINLDDDIDEILDQIGTSQHTRLLVYTGEINRVAGILHLRNLSRFMQEEEFNKAMLMQITREPYFVPEGTPLHAQLINFQKLKRRIGIVVDEYGDIQGLVTLEDILEEIVGEFTTDFSMLGQEITPQADGSYFLDGSTSVRDVNRSLHWKLPTDGAKTISGLIIEYLQYIPTTNICVNLHGHLFETVQIKDNTIKSVKVRLYRFELKESE